MKKLISVLVILLFLFVLLPTIVNAGGTNDDNICIIDDSTEYQEKELYVGYGATLGSSGSNICKIIEGDAGQLNKHNQCYLDAVKPGEVTTCVYKKSDKTTVYYKYKILKSPESVSELDEKYVYSDVDKCELFSQGHRLGGKVSFDGLTFCGSSLPGYNFEVSDVNCKDNNYETFKLTFTTSDGNMARGFGCRKLKNNDDIQYVKRILYLGESSVISHSNNYTCSIISGDSIYLDSKYLKSGCNLVTQKLGVSRIKAYDNKLGKAYYYEYEVFQAPESLSELDPNYVYDDVQSCTMKVEMYASILSNIRSLNGVKFCLYGGYDSLPDADVKCADGYEKFAMAITATNNFGDPRVYNGYGCRKLKQSEPELGSGNELYGCEVIPDSIRTWINDTLNLVKYIALALVIVLGILDFLKAAGSGEAEAMKKSGTSFLKRIIAVIILFLLPLIVDLILNLIEIAGADSTCLPN